METTVIYCRPQYRRQNVPNLIDTLKSEGGLL